MGCGQSWIAKRKSREWMKSKELDRYVQGSSASSISKTQFGAVQCGWMGAMSLPVTEAEGKRSAIASAQMPWMDERQGCMAVVGLLKGGTCSCA